jgi:choline dehydrogenase-like flavoprotein
MIGSGIGGLVTASQLAAKEDYQVLVRSRGRDTANLEVRRRRRSSNRIQSVGNDVTRDAYAPFANFLSTLTG